MNDYNIVPSLLLSNDLEWILKMSYVELSNEYIILYGLDHSFHTVMKNIFETYFRIILFQKHFTLQVIKYSNSYSSKGTGWFSCMKVSVRLKQNERWGIINKMSYIIDSPK